MRILFLLIITSLIGCKKETAADVSLLRDGDIIFQTSTSAQSRAIQLATHTEYSHCGIVYKDKGRYFVFEAIQPVTKTPLSAWIARGKDSHYTVKRLKDTRALTPLALTKMKTAARAMNGKNYDLYFEWSDDRIYCSELIWKLYKNATGLEVGHLKKLKDFNLSAPAVQQKMKERYGNNIPMDEKVISPADIYNSDLLKTVIEK
ncbi:YiiX family permuted papain-like enzyme [Flavobacterium psychrotrophum]|uniref:YiiX family permuted papain-like enzyme n=1 Tax=Flavobacterium psychrotrophum TaxID=2294119 RepID=UPI000E323BF9|nr:YiiX family permuted papain-like enzyme [Flavobacterium psychrotrophum]